MGFFMIPKVLLTLFILSLTIGCVVGTRQCTNEFPKLTSHIYRHALLSSKNETWKHEIFSRSRNFLTPDDESHWESLLPRRMMRQEDQTNWMMLNRQTKDSKGANENREFLKEVPLNHVRLDPNSMHGLAQKTALEYLLILDVDRLLWSFRKTAGLPNPGEPYGGWESPTEELRGHFVGHYLSATALMWASTNNDAVKAKMNALVSGLSECQNKMGTGYLSAFPTEFIDRVEALIPVWAPYYSLHKVMAGLLDQYTIAGNVEALKILKGMADYHYNRVKNVIVKYSIQRHWDSINSEEFGGMNDVLYRLYAITGDHKHLLLAHLFDKPCFLGELAVQADDIAGFHTNTHIPVVVGAQMRYEVTGDPLYKEIGLFFMEMINASHVYATGGTSADEHWTDPKRLATTLGTENEETCTTYNMLKVARNVFRWTKELKYADYYERALTNGILSVQRGREPGIMIYMLPLKPGASKAVSYQKWGTLYNTFWCCYGTALESFSKLGDSIYFEEEGKVPGLYIIQYISNSFQWLTGGIQLNQTVTPVVAWDNRLQVTLTITSEQAETVQSTLKFRIPSWTNTNAAKALLNDQKLYLAAAGNLLSVTKKWSSGDKISLEFPMSLRLEAILDDRPEYASLHSIHYGPFLLAGLTTGEWDIKASPDAPVTDWISPIQADYNDKLITVSQMSGKTNFVLSKSNESIQLQEFPTAGTNEAADATFRLISSDPNTNFSSFGDAIDKSVMLEPYAYPGMVVSYQDADKPLHLLSTSSNKSSGSNSVFHLVAGLDGKNGTVSFESENKKGCYIKSDIGSSITLGCNNSGSSNADFSQAVSFNMDKGMSEYHPISFIAQGETRKFLLAPLLSLRDETYTVYFNV